MGFPSRSWPAGSDADSSGREGWNEFLKDERYHHSKRRLSKSLEPVIIDILLSDVDETYLFNAVLAGILKRTTTDCPHLSI